MVGMSAVAVGSHLLADVAGWPTALALRPSFVDAPPLASGSYHVLLLWPPLFFANIVGEEVMWRGALLPRQELTYGERAWIANGSGWLLFHAAFGPGMMVLLAPLIYAQAWACQRSGSTTVGIVIHGVVNASGFLATALLA